MTVKISAYLIAFNEARKIKAAIESVLWADEVVVVDSFSTDNTADIAQQLGATVVQVPFSGFGELRNAALAACAGEWIFSLDCDERCTAEVREEILTVIANDTPPHELYLVPRRNFFMGRWIRHSGWYPNFRQPQLFRRGAMSYSLDAVHEGFVSHSQLPVGQLQQAIWQMPFENFHEVIRKANRYSDLGAVRLQQRQVTMGMALRHGLWAFTKHYVFKAGFLDGWAGFVIALGNFEGTFYRYAKAYEKQQHWSLPASSPLRRSDES
ncbi:glycosyltransferase family 2 protein [Thioflexithrix psekupsensis]|uniref:Alpha-L-glycero-D-manno-heptose beta-1,4-glucosyltransferase n=1 Tax=Thioflexithrix psekupsensis TaxID=1570016 RepID=A0A251X565_9GAMM|nr:glycosyltransferase family 2 protein [Thioflexithrix psekupsensis]OUD12633.1 alpha-L-glycero-D-manno-heptose beta-1,4-glucosyltransferase [Thioflexithrix psekupsensis]